MDASQSNYLAFSKPFIDTIKSVFETMVGEPIQHGKPELTKNTPLEGGYTTNIGMNGILEKDEVKIKFQGSMTLHWEMSDYLALSNSVLGTDFKEFNEEIADFGMEISNMTMGGAKTVLNPLGYKIEMAIPNSVVDGVCTFEAPNNTIIIKIPFHNDLTKFSLEIFYKEGSLD